MSVELSNIQVERSRAHLTDSMSRLGKLRQELRRTNDVIRSAMRAYEESVSILAKVERHARPHP